MVKVAKLACRARAAVGVARCLSEALVVPVIRVRVRVFVVRWRISFHCSWRICCWRVGVRVDAAMLVAVRVRVGVRVRVRVRVLRVAVAAVVIIASQVAVPFLVLTVA